MKTKCSFLLAVGALCVLCGSFLPGTGGLAIADPIFYPAVGFEDDVDVIVAPGGGFLIMPQEPHDEGWGMVTVIALDPFTGQPLGEVSWWTVPGFERGVDPIILPEFPEGGHPVVIPVESKDGNDCGVLLLLLNPAGDTLDSRWIELGNLGFREDVDPVWTHYMNPAIAFVALESEDHLVRGVLAIDVDPHDEGGDGIDPWGTCILLSTDGRYVCGTWDAEVDWLPGLADGADPVAYETELSARLALPVASEDGCDILLLDFDPHFEPPSFEGHESVKELNADGEHPLEFPGFERDVHIRVLEGECGAGVLTELLLVPVEGSGDNGDLYCLNEDGDAEWVLSEVAETLGLSVPGYEAGVDVVPMCSLGEDPEHRLVVPLENEAGTDADLWIIDIVTGSLVARAEDPAVNPDLTIPGYEIGVDVIRWDQDRLLVPVEGGDEAGLLVLDNHAVLIDELLGSPIMGFERSVDAIVAPLSDPDRKLYVPVETADGSDADIIIFPAVGDLGEWDSLEELNTGLVLSGFEWDVDAGLVDHWLPGQAWLYLPEEDASGTPARLRCQPVTAAARILVFATPEVGAAMPATLYTVHGITGDLLTEIDEVYGLETGLDLSNGAGQVTTGNPPWFDIAAGFDGDTDPTHVTGVGASAVPDGEAPTDPEDAGWRLSHPNPMSAPGQVYFNLRRADDVRVAIVDAAGRQVRELLKGHTHAGEHEITWDGRDDRGSRVASGIYFLQVRGARGIAVSKLVVLR